MPEVYRAVTLRFAREAPYFATLVPGIKFRGGVIQLGLDDGRLVAESYSNMGAPTRIPIFGSSSESGELHWVSCSKNPEGLVQGTEPEVSSGIIVAGLTGKVPGMDFIEYPEVTARILFSTATDGESACCGFPEWVARFDEPGQRIVLTLGRDDSNEHWRTWYLELTEERRLYLRAIYEGQPGGFRAGWHPTPSWPLPTDPDDPGYLLEEAMVL